MRFAHFLLYLISPLLRTARSVCMCIPRRVLCVMVFDRHFSDTIMAISPSKNTKVQQINLLRFFMIVINIFMFSMHITKAAFDH